MSNAHDDLAYLLKASRVADQPSARDRELARAAFSAKIGADLLADNSQLTVSRASAFPPAFGTSLLAKILVGVVLTLGGSAGLLVLSRSAKHSAPSLGTSTHVHTLPGVSSQPSPSPLSPPSAPSPPATVITLHAVPEGLRTHEPTVANHVVIAHSLVPTNLLNPVPLESSTTGSSETNHIGAGSPLPSVEAEVTALASAQHALREHQPVEALRRLDDYESRFPHGVLQQEQRAVRILVLCDLGRIAEARSEGEQFVRNNPSSPLSARILASCASRP